MVSRTRWFWLGAPLVLALSACSTGGGTGARASGADGAVELAVSQTCSAASDSDCVSINGENVVRPSAFERAGVERAAVIETEGQNAVGVTFDDRGAEVLHTLTKQAARAGDTARLVIEVGGELQAAPAVLHAVTGDHLQIVLAPKGDAQQLVNLIHQD